MTVEIRVPEAVEHAWSNFQLAVLEHPKTSRQHLIVRARAGCAKTTTALQLVKAYVEAFPKHKVLMAAFNGEIVEALKSKHPEYTQRGSNVDIRTFHSLGFRLVRQRLSSRAELDNRKIYKLADAELEADRKAAAEAKARAVVMSAEAIPEPTSLELVFQRSLKDRMFWVISMLRNTLQPATQQNVEDLFYRYLNETEADDLVPSAGILAEAADRLMKLSQQRLKTVDFDEMIWLPAVKRLSYPAYNLVVVDELQDLNECQLEAVMSMARRNAMIVGVGDPAQSIYVWRGAALSSMSRLQKSLNAVELPLSITYRCPRKHVQMANKLVPELEARPGAPLGRVELRTLDDALKHLRPNDMILSRCNAPLLRVALKIAALGRKVSVHGRDMLKQLLQFSRKFGSRGPIERYVAAMWKYEERLQAKGVGESDEGIDWCNALRAVTTVSKTVEELEARLSALFSDSTQGVVCSTVHRAKGLESDRVLIIDAGRLPLEFQTMSDEQREEEEHVLYVALTRSKRVLTVATTPNKNGKVIIPWWLAGIELDVDTYHNVNRPPDPEDQKPPVWGTAAAADEVSTDEALEDGLRAARALGLTQE